MKVSLIRAVAVIGLLTLPLGVVAQGNPHGSAPLSAGKKMTTEEALKQAPKLDKALVPLEKGMKDAEAKMKKSPKDAKAKKAYVDATYKYAHTITFLPQGTLSPSVQYRASLALYRRVLAVDPRHKESLAEKKTIDDIYKTMPGGIPK